MILAQLLTFLIIINVENSFVFMLTFLWKLPGVNKKKERKKLLFNKEIKLSKHDDKDIYKVTKDFYFK